MQETYENKLNKAIAIILIITLTAANILIVGINFVSYAIDMVATSSNNVEFEAYFKNADGEKVKSLEENINAEDMNLYVDISVLREGYFNGKITLENSNFNIVGCTKNSYLNSIDGNTINLNQINAGNTITMELQVKPSIDTSFNVDILDAESEVKLTGTYVSSKGEEEISGTTNVNLKLVSAPEIEAGIEAEILTNKNYTINGENKRVIQVLIKSKLLNDVYPIKNTNIEVSVPKDAENIEVYARSTDATNSNIEFGENNFTYDASKGIFKLGLENNANEEGKISYNKAQGDELVVTYIYNESKTFENIANENGAQVETADQTNQDTLADAQILVNSQITTWDGKELTANKNIAIDEEIDGIINYEITEAEKEIYKGKIYSGEAREYQTRARAYVNNIEANKNIEFTLKESTYLAQDVEKASNIEYKETKISKEEFTNILGENGYITIKDNKGNVIENITNETKVDESGNIVVEYPAAVKGITITASTPISTGKIDFINTKAILKGEYTKDELKELTAIKEEISENGEIKEFSIELKETTTQAKLDVSTTTLRAEETNENVLIKVTLLTNDESKDLYKNPRIKITFPSKVADIDVKHKILYGNGLELESSVLKEENGQKVLEIKLKGEQTAYPGDAIDGTVIMVSADLELDKLATSSKENITLTYTNENAINYENMESSQDLTSLASVFSLEEIDETTSEQVATEGTVTKDIEILQENSFIVTNDIKDFDVATIGKEEDKIIELESTGENKTATIEIGAINNEGETLQNVKILGKFPTKNVANTMDITLKSGINVTSSAENVKVYYSAKENPTEDLTDSENEWSENSNLEGMNSYLIVIGSMANGEKFSANYEINIPEDLTEKQVAVESFEVKYTKANGEEKVVGSTKVGFSTEQADALDMKLQAIVGGDILNDGDDIKQGEVIKYNISLTNNGSKDIANITVTGNVPEGTSLYVTQDANEEENQPEGTTKVFENVSIKQGETVSLSYQVKVANDAKEGTGVVAQVSTNYNEDIVQTHNFVKSADIVLELKVNGRSENNTIKSGYTYGYLLKVTNNSNEDKNNIDINVIENGLLEMSKLSEFEFNETITIDTIEANSTYYIGFGAQPKEVINDNRYVKIYATAKYNGLITRSNLVTEEIESIVGEIKVTSTTSESINENLVEGDDITYTILFQNNGKYDVSNLIIKDKISDYLQVEKVELNNQDEDYNFIREYNYNDDYSDVVIHTKAKVGESVKIIVNAKVKENNSKDSIEFTNIAKAYDGINYICESNEELYYIEPSISNEDDTGTTDIPNVPDSPIESDSRNTYKINGKVWVDEDENGTKDSNEENLEGIEVRLIDINTGKIIQDAEGKQISAKTDNNGIYTLANIPEGKYIVKFLYNTDEYMPTTYQKEGVSTSSNSDAILKEMLIDGENVKVAATDTIEVNRNILNVDLGLIEVKKFDLELSKYVNKIVVTNKEETKKYEFNNSTLAKVEISTKNLDSSKVAIEYTIEIKNTGELAGYVKSIVDYVSPEIEFSSSLNQDWYKQGDYLYNISLANTELKPGETKEIKLILMKTMTENNTGLINNIAEIAQSTNTREILDIDSTEANRKNGEDDMGQADIIISIKTGVLVNYILLIFLILVVIGGGVYLINEKIINKDFNS